jgi:xylulose-5-phosphate/fructose-6-phosphate phosphoketolase
MTSTLMAPQGKPQMLSDHDLQQLHAWWRAANYLAVGMIYLQDNPLLKEPLRPEHIKKPPVGALGF